jgi:transcriptional regulator with GAF, ATPase, and Fis domain
VVGSSSSWKETLRHVGRVAASDTTVLITGESGTGKEVIASLIHHGSSRAGKPFIAINCAALPEQLLESELFGHEKGSFTGAIATKVGRIEQAEGGTLFLDEIGEMSPQLQAKFLRVLEAREFQRVGATRTLRANVRVIAATNRDVPRGPLLPAERLPDPDRAAARAQGRHPAAGRGVPDGSRPQHGASGRRHLARCA